MCLIPSSLQPPIRLKTATMMNVIAIVCIALSSFKAKVQTDCVWEVTRGSL
jgi:hypothetical protein